MRTLYLIMAVAIVSGAAHADEKECIIAAATRLPPVAGLTIRSSEVVALTAEQAAKWRQNPSPPVLINIAVNAAGQDATYTYLCGQSKHGMFVRPLPDGKLP